MSFYISRLMLIFLFVLTIPSFAVAQDLMSLEEVGNLLDADPNHEVKATFKSVERGTYIKTYDIILRGISEQPGLKIIMFVSSNRIAAGMSGSPVYIDGKLIGAVAYQLNNPNLGSHSNDWAWGGISPISLMIEENKSGRALFGGARTFTYQGMVFKPIDVGLDSSDLLNSFSRTKIDTITALANSSSSSTKPVLSAGMPIIVDVIEWSDNKGKATLVSAMGTITYIDDDNRIYAFGHPFLGSKNVVYSFRTAEVMGTVFQDRSYKLGWKTSEVLGAITFDGAYGIYGKITLDDLAKLHHFNLEFKNQGKVFNNFKIKVADSSLASLLAQSAFSMIGNIYGAPMPEEQSSTQFNVKIELNGHNPITWNELFASTTMQFGPSTIHTSSYDLAYRAFFRQIYDMLHDNRYGLKISNVFVSADFILGRNQVLKLGAYKFPNKIIYGQNPSLEILLVSQDNSLAIGKKVVFDIDWNRVERPIYTKETLDIDKANEKIVRGLLKIESATYFIQNLAGSEKQKLRPEYFLGLDDFLDNLSSQLAITNQKIFAKVNLKSKSGLFDEEIARIEDIVPNNLKQDDSGWTVLKEGLKERKTTIKDEGLTVFYINLPSVPIGYVIDQGIQELYYFEVILDN